MRLDKLANDEITDILLSLIIILKLYYFKFNSK